MARLIDVAEYILSKTGPITAMKLQKMMYYSQAWSLVWDDKPIFRDRIEAWANGPVIPKLYNLHRGRFKLSAGHFGGHKTSLSKDEQDTLNAVLKYYGHRSSLWLSELTHKERPWKEARDGLAPGDRGRAEITPAALEGYYGGLVGVSS